MPETTAVIAVDWSAATLWWIAGVGAAIAYITFLLAWRDRTLGWVQFGLAAAVSLALITSDQDGWVYLGVVIALVAIMSMAARQFAKTTMRIIVVLSVLLAVLLVARVGTTRVQEKAYEDARNTLPEDVADLCLDDDTGLECLDRVRSVQVADSEALAAATAAYVDDELTDKLGKIRARVRSAVSLSVLNAAAANAANVAEEMQDAAYGPPEALVKDLSAQEQVLDTASPPSFRARQGAVLTAIASVFAAVDVEAAEDAATTAQKAKDQAQEALNEVPAVDLVTAGADEIVETWVEPITGKDVDVPVSLGALAWVLLLVGAVLAYRRLEWRNNQSYGAPVQISELKVKGDGLDGAFLTEGIKVRYGSTDLVEPPDTPGGSAFESVQTTLTEAGGDHGKIAAAITKFAQATAFPKSGITVTGVVSLVEPTGDGKAKAAAGTSPDKENADAEDEKAEGDQRVSAVLRLETSHEHRFIRTERMRADTQGQLMDRAAALIAGDVLSYSYWTPSWAKAWGERGEALATYRRMLFDRPSDGEQRISELTGAIGSAPSNGLLRLMLAHELDLAGRPVEALRLNLQNRIDHPHFLAGRYRLVTSLSMLSDPNLLREHWWSLSASQTRKEVLRLIASAPLLRHGSVKNEGPSSNLRDQPRGFKGRRWFEPWRIWRRKPSSSAAGRFWERERRPSMSAGEVLESLELEGLGIADGGAQVSLALLEWARYEARELRTAYRPWRLAVRMLRQDQRMAYAGVLRSAKRWRRDRGQVRSVQAIIEARSLQARRATQASATVEYPSVPLADLNVLRRRVGRLTSDRRAGSPALYNAACFWAVAADIVGEEARSGAPAKEWLDLSLRALERSLRVAEGSRPAKVWLEADPDLRLLRETPGWRHVLKRIDDEAGSDHG